jgi:hypothetical protein
MERRWMKIVRYKDCWSEDFYARVRECSVATHERLIAADLATPEIREYLNAVRISFSGRLVRSAGRAKLKTNGIVLNIRLLVANPDNLLEVIVHEVAHLLAHRLYADGGHGEAWQRRMVTLGFEPKRCHAMDTRFLRPPGPFGTSSRRGSSM